MSEARVNVVGRVAIGLAVALVGCGSREIDTLGVDAAADRIDAAGGSGAEYCFNGIDDDGNGLVDCMDPACAPVAECVPDETAAGWELGTKTPPGAAAGANCPPYYKAQTTTVNEGLAAPVTCQGCTCTPSLICSVAVEELSANTCPGGSPIIGEATTADNVHCENNGGAAGGWNFTTGNVRVGLVSTTAACTGSGMPSPTPATWNETADFCSTVFKGGGCIANLACVPKLATGGSHCVLAAGGRSCPAPYSPVLTEPWYTGFDDARDCGATCTGVCGVSGGTCGRSFVRAYLDSSCTGSADFLTANQDNCGESVGEESFEVTLGTDAVQPACPVTYSPTGSATPTGPVTLCCL